MLILPQPIPMEKLTWRNIQQKKTPRTTRHNPKIIRYYLTMLWGYGGESSHMLLEKEGYEYWKEQYDEEGDYPNRIHVRRRRHGRI